MNVALFNNGCCLDLGLPFTKDSSKEKRAKKGGGKRKSLSGKLSIASFRRLRQFCITHDCAGTCWGITLTVPGLDIVSDAEFKRLVHLLTQFANYWDLPLIWRCELQRRGQPHLHLVLYTESVSDVSRLLAQWQKLVSSLSFVYNPENCQGVNEIVYINRAFVNGSVHMFDVQRLFGDFRSWRYLVAHASKGKQAQSGWRGRQWGVLCRRSFICCDPHFVELEDREMFSLRRWVRRYSYRRIGNHGKHFILISPQDVGRMIKYLRDDYYGAPF